MGIHHATDFDGVNKAPFFPELSSHARQRIRQRGIKEAQVDLVMRYGTPVDNGAFMLRKADVEREILARKREIQSLEKLRNCKVVLSGGVLVTAYRPVGRKEKATIRRMHENCCGG